MEPQSEQNKQSYPLCFVASPSQPADLLIGLSEAISSANKQSEFQYQLWTKNDIAGRDLVQPIHENIQNSALFVADVTYLNQNVTYEVGYAIGQGKRVLLTRYRGFKGDIDLANDIGIFDTLGRMEYDTFGQLGAFLALKHDLKPVSTDYPIDTVKRLYFLDIPGSGDVIRQVVSAIKREFRLYRSFSDEETVRLAASVAIEGVSASSGVVIPYLADHVAGAMLHNYRAMFVAGLAHGLERPVLILKSSRVVAPIDIRDSMSDYDTPADIDRLIAKFRNEVEAGFEQLNSRTPGRFGILQQLSVGDAAAENEFTTLKSYYIQTDAFGRTLQGQVDLVTGRKGSGKTALFFQVRDRLRSNKDNIVVDLKPEGYQLTQLKEKVLKYLQTGSQTYLITTFWHYLILMEIVHRIIETDAQRQKFDHRLTQPYQELLAIYRKGDVEFEGDFSQRLLILTRTIADRYQSLKVDVDSLSSAEITQVIYLHDIRALEQALSKYLRFKDEVWILFDNLDKGWSAGGVSKEDIVILRCLIDAAKKIRNDLVQKKVNFHAVVFIRNDVFELLIEGTADYGKDRRASLDWTDRRQLVELLMRRLEYGHKDFRTMPNKEIWATIFADGREPDSGMNLFLDHSLLRPRNLIQLFQHCKGFAVNVAHDRITGEDLENALEAYSRDLVTEINREIGDVFPQAPRVLYDLAHEHSEMTHDDLMVFGELKQLDRNDSERLIDLLFYYAVIGLPEEQGKCTFIYDTQYDMDILKALARKRGGVPTYRIHQAFWPALRIKPPIHSKPDEPSLF
ncbi:MAG: hypothetical protein WCE79_04170 [Xanthobacteraceae bacterium]